MVEGLTRDRWSAIVDEIRFACSTVEMIRVATTCYADEMPSTTFARKAIKVVIGSKGATNRSKGLLSLLRLGRRQFSHDALFYWWAYPQTALCRQPHGLECFETLITVGAVVGQDAFLLLRSESFSSFGK